ncbi:polysaccharide deacetylase family protein [Actinoplanes sp. N902-109]|uniref:polysaccharide deacetylase family protein n=1 Tax=Actinoplanes sp. (strain N902-109) TaxID=649831 RepID=UPI0006865DF3|nr:polysaccharide deacetylase family protein [Actinoplanes sp. N902-109]
MPQVSAGSLAVHRVAGWLTRAVLWVLAVVIVVVPVRMALHLLNSHDLPDQLSTPMPAVSGQERASWQAAGVGLPSHAPPVVLAYHDIRPGSGDDYVVSPERFERQLMALAAAGYRTITSDEYAAYLGGAPAGPRSVYLTFDDGTEGLYLYADRILRRQRAHAASYLISGRVGEYRPYYLTWPEVTRMAASGRWDFQAHTHDLHTRGAVGEKRVNGSLLTGRAWVADDTRLETDAEHHARIERDVGAQLRDFERHDLPRPRLFAYPFSDLGSRRDTSVRRDTARLIDTTYAAAFTNETTAPAPTSRRAARGGEIQRIEVMADTTPAQLVRQVVAWTAIAPDKLEPLTDHGRWWDSWTRTVPPLGVFTGSDPAPTGKTYVQASYAPFGSADWRDYRVRADIAGLEAGGNNANVTVRVGGAGAITCRVAYAGVQVVDQDTGRIRTSASLDGNGRHLVDVEVTAGTTTVSVDGDRIAVVRAPGTTGGLALSIRRETDSTMPRFAALTVEAVTAG